MLSASLFFLGYSPDYRFLYLVSLLWMPGFPPESLFVPLRFFFLFSAVNFFAIYFFCIFWFCLSSPVLLWLLFLHYSLILGYFCLPLFLGKEPETKVLHPFPEASSISEEKPGNWSVTLRTGSLTALQNLVTFEILLRWGTSYFPFWQHVKKWLINKFPWRWRAFSAVPADKA